MPSKGNLSHPGESGRTPRARACSICVRSRPGTSSSPTERRFEMLMVRLQDRVSQRTFLTPPGGGIEIGETPLAAALRETLEETGYAARALTGRGEPVTVRYDFVWEGRTYDCTTTFFLCELVNPEADPRRVEDADYNHGAAWVPLEEVEETLAFMPTPRNAVMNCLRSFLAPAPKR